MPASEVSEKPSFEARVGNGTGVAGVMWTGVREEPSADSGREIRLLIRLENLAGRSDGRTEGKGIPLIGVVELGRMLLEVEASA